MLREAVENGHASSDGAETELRLSHARELAISENRGGNGAEEHGYAALDTGSDTSEGTAEQGYEGQSEASVHESSQNGYQDSGSLHQGLDDLRRGPSDSAEQIQQRAWWTTTQIPQFQEGTGQDPVPSVGDVIDVEPEDIHLDGEKKAAIIGAMKNVKLEYVPPWATRISEADFSKQVDALTTARRQQPTEQNSAWAV